MLTFCSILEILGRCAWANNGPLLIDNLNSYGQYIDRIAPKDTIYKCSMLVKANRSIAALLFLLLVDPQVGEHFTASNSALASSSKTSSSKAHQLTEEAMVAQKAGNFAQAEPLFLEALQIREKGFQGVPSSLLIGSMERLADCYFLQGKYSQAQLLYLRAVAARRQASVAKDSGLVRDLTNLAVLYQRQGKTAEADDVSKQALTIVENQWGEGLELANALVARAKVLLDTNILLGTNQAPTAIALLDRALSLRLKEAKGNDSSVSSILTTLAKAYLESDNYHAAEKSLKQALAIDLANSGRESLPVVVDLSTIGQLYLRQGKYAASEHAYVEALKICIRLKGEKHPETAACKNNLALLYLNMGDLSKAEALLRSGLEIREQNFGVDHPLVAQNLINLADVLVDADQSAEAESLLVRALTIEVAALGQDHDYVALIERELVEILQTQSTKLAEAEKYARRLLEHDKSVSGEDSLLTARDLESLGKILIAQDKIAEAKPLIEKARAIESMQKGMFFQHEANMSGFGNTAKNSGIIFTKPIQDKWALVVGISSFQDPSLNLRFAAKDAVDFRNFLVNQAGFQADHVKLLTDHEATRANIVALLGDKWMKRVVKADDLAVVYISSHGTQAASQVGGANFIVPYEGNAHNIVFSGIPMQWLLAGLKDLVHSDRICVFLDVCHSGAAASIRTGSSQHGQEIEEASTVAGGKALYRIRDIGETVLASPPGQVVVAASQADQISWESKRYSNSVFTRRLIEGLAINGKDTTLEQAFVYLRDRVEEEVLRDRTQIQAPVVVPKLEATNAPQLGCKTTNPRPADKEADSARVGGVSKTLGSK